jgi:hypothetical protein
MSTFRVKIKEEHPEKVNNKRFVGGVSGCPYMYGYEEFNPNNGYCIDENLCCDCWDREIQERSK